MSMQSAMCPPSLSARRAWIEIYCRMYTPGFAAVALRKESVDRNFDIVAWDKSAEVALRKESVDRNSYCPVVWRTGKVVALRKESVDRNCPNT